MKRLTLLAAGVFVGMLFFANGAFAQDYLELLRSDLKTMKVAIVTEAMQLNQEESEKFWPIYREYEMDLSSNYDRRIALIQEYGENYMNMSDEKAKELTLDLFSIEKQRINMWRKYYYKVERVLSSTLAARFVQVERQISLLVDLQIAAELPLISEP